ncbi:YGGT family [Acididesulfobacillus acetoxydans]|uniref:YGGT family n=1 Tax=Acididesulfobacillus acetoxydans TaxID=1561005 RepID=A0A8S0X111_9FIRM|nr:YggT family protein [Acididesulfobacillus acetoxydans]CAA7602871.1 YGGT family [Acididesulfobacillus acetoxydans]CEJ05752.1 YGGT family [Acididesulfobacillus acetoxydans]
MAEIVDNVVTILTWAIVIRALLSFAPNLRDNALVRLLNDVTEPLLRPFRRFQIGGGGFAVDFSPILAIIVLNIIRTVLLRVLGGGF